MAKIDYKDKNNLQEFLIFQKKVIKEYIKYIRKLMQGSNEEYKKASLVIRWLCRYVEYLKREEKFLPSRHIRYVRGQIVFVNFGFRVGNEFGGPHYAVVMDVKNARNTATMTVCPLKSYKGSTSQYANIYCVHLGMVAGLEKDNVADCGQIVTISKLRVITPCIVGDDLSNVFLPPDKMSMIDEKLKKLYFNVDNTI